MYQHHAGYLSLRSLTIMTLLSTVSDSPILRLDTCSESEVRFICTVNRTELQWKINFSKDPDILSVRYFSDDMIGSRGDVLTNGVIFYLTSTTPLISIMTANVSRVLDGATVICQDGFTDAALENKLSLHGPQKSYNVSIIANIEPEMSTLSASLEWKVRDGYSNTTGNLEYFFTIWPSLLDQGVSSFNTTETSLLLNLSHDQEYHMRMIASNCIGNSTPINISIGRCPILPGTNTLTSFRIEYSTSIVGDQINFTCHLGPRDKLDAACRNYSGNETTNTSTADLTSIICSNGTLNEGGHGDDNVTVYVATKVTVNIVAVVLSASLGSIFLLALISINVLVLFIILCKHRRKQGTMIIEQNHYTEVQHSSQQYQELYTRLEQPSLPTESRNSTFMPSSELETIINHEIDIDKMVNLDSLLIQLRLQVTAKWHQFGTAVDIPDEILEQYSSYPADERLIEVLDYWLNNSGTPGPTWRDVAKVLSDIELYELAEGIMNVYETGCLPIEVDVDDSDSDDTILLPLPFPSNVLSTTDNPL